MIGAPNKNVAGSHPAAEGNDRQDSRPEGTWYEIRVKGHLGPDWSDWFEGLALLPLENGEMLLSGHIVDQAALLGVLIKLNRLNLALLSVQSPGE